MVENYGTLLKFDPKISQTKSQVKEMQPNMDVFEESRRIEQAMKNGYSWFDMMYPRGSEAEAKELKIGKYADSTLNKIIKASYKDTVVQSDRLTGRKRARNS